MRKQTSSSRIIAKENKFVSDKVVAQPSRTVKASNSVSPGPIDLQIVQGLPFSPVEN